MTIENATSVIIENATIQPTALDWPSYILVGTTIVLAFITFLYMRETKRLREATEELATETKNIVSETAKMREAAQQPSFAIEPSNYIMGYDEKKPGEKFSKLNLVNYGATATDITVRCMWLDSETGGGSERSFYVISLARDGYAGLKIPSEHIKKIIDQKQFLKIEIKCKDAAGKDYSTVITNGLDKIRGKNVELSYQNNKWQTIYDAINNIYMTLMKIEFKLK